MTLNLFDSHVNLHGEIYEEDRSDVIFRAREAGVSRMIGICDELANFDKVRAIANANANMWCTVGVHPHHAKDYLDLSASTLVDLAQDKTVCGIGETGLDLHYGYSPLEDQVSVFKQHILAAQSTQLPLVIHTREADDLMGDILEEEMSTHAFQPLMHCYTSGQRLAERAIELGAYFSVSGIATFKKASDVREVIQQVPLDKIILETDCPYLAPTPHRGRRNEPAYLVEVCRIASQLYGLSLEEMATVTTENCLRLFGRTS